MGYAGQVLAILDALMRRDGEGTQDFLARACRDPLARRILLAELEERHGRRHVELATSRLRLREIRLADWRAIHRYASDPEVVRHLDWGPNTEQETRAEVEASVARRTSIPRVEFFLAAALRTSGEVIGVSGLTLAANNPAAASLAYTFERRHWGQGYATETASEMMRFGFENLNLHRIGAECDVENTGSIRILEKVGMKREGHVRGHRRARGAWRDSFVYGILRPEWRSPHVDSQPRPLAGDR
ncbi:MAG TPA: GNAT family protein [Anaeromyxobacteraceae bacterium]|nr:GNAT family protein [Anaeromyxobacteraceae bacterium]